MMRWLKRPQRSNLLPTQAATAPGDRIYAIGDVHGRADLLARLIEIVGDHERGLPPGEPAHIVLLGDLIDRGPQSAEVLEMVRGLQRSRPHVHALLGNHEQVLLDVLGGSQAALHAWLDFGGEEALTSFGITLPVGYLDPVKTAAALSEALPDGTVDWLRSLPLSLRSGDYFFCHAGVRPGVPLERQSRDDLLWIREAFLESDADHGVIVVHGHSVVHSVDQCANHIGIDTGAYASGRLTALFLEGTERAILTAQV